MFIWRLWGDVWYIGDGEDYLTYLIMACVMSVLLACLTAVVVPTIVIPTLIFRAFFERKQQNADVTFYLDKQSQQHETAVALLEHAEAAPPRTCPSCGWVSSQDIRPCVRCGR